VEFLQSGAMIVAIVPFANDTATESDGCR
jgi:hypothetical protein